MICRLGEDQDANDCCLCSVQPDADGDDFWLAFVSDIREIRSEWAERCKKCQKWSEKRLEKIFRLNAGFKPKNSTQRR